MGALACEATRKIHAIFFQLSSLLHKENQTLKGKVGKLETELSTVTKNFDNAKMWRENVLNGCPVLFQESGQVFALKLFGKLMAKTDKLPQGAAGFPHAAVQSEHNIGTFQYIISSNSKGWFSENQLGCLK